MTRNAACAAIPIILLAAFLNFIEAPKELKAYLRDKYAEVR
jgi:hypothetical protein